MHHCYIGLRRCCVPPCHIRQANATCFFGTICGAGGPITSLTRRSSRSAYGGRLTLSVRPLIEMPITPTVEYFANPAVVLRRIEVLTRPSPIPSTRGIYAWYFNGLKEFELCDCPRLESGAALLYVGISPFRFQSHNTLRKRIRTHLAGNASSSTLRLTLGCLLSARLDLRLQETGRTRRLTFGEGEHRLNQWLSQNAFVAWQPVAEPWLVEGEFIGHFTPPLNLQHNSANPFYQVVAGARAKAREDVRSGK